MSIDSIYVEKLFENLRTNPELFWEKVADDVHWTVKGTNPLAGVYFSKEDFLNHTFRRLAKIIEGGVRLKINTIHLADHTAIVEMDSISVDKRNQPFNNTYCWIAKFNENGMITRVTAYIDTALVSQVIEENEKLLFENTAVSKGKQAKLTVIYPLPVDIEAFEKKYLQEHVPMVMEKLTGKTQIIRNHVTGVINSAKKPIHRIAEIYFPSMQVLDQSLNSPAGQEVMNHAVQISSGGEPTFVISEVETSSL